jgi:hypothetical protein
MEKAGWSRSRRKPARTRTASLAVADQAIALVAPRIGTRAACAVPGVAQAGWSGGTGPA